jgi:hypothetical protein
VLSSESLTTGNGGIRVACTQTRDDRNVIVEKCALGVIQNRGQTTVDPDVVSFGPNESDYLARHVSKVRGTVDVGARSVFQHAANTPSLLETLRTTSSDGHYAATAKTLQDALAKTMKTSTNAKDCVLAAVRAKDADGGDSHVTILKLDAVVEAARMKRLRNSGVTFEVLRGLLPEPGRLQKALSWPDPRPSSALVVLDTNFAMAQYFEIAYQVQVSPRAVEAEEQLVRTISQRVDARSIPRVIASAGTLEGPLDTVLTELSKTYPELDGAAAEITSDGRPAGIIRRNKVTARPVIWKAPGLELRISPEVAATVNKVRTQVGTWRLTVETAEEPHTLGLE